MNDGVLTFEEMLRLQEEFASAHWERMGLNPTGSPEDRRTVLREQVLVGISEVMEVLGEDSWKVHRLAPPSEVVRYNVAEEVADVLKAMLGVLLAYDVTAEEFAEVYRAKSALVTIRLRQEVLLRRVAESGQPVVAVDLDEVLCFNREELRRWAWEAWPETRGKVPKDALSPARYEELKRAWRESGLKADLPECPGAVEAARRLYDLYGGRLVVLSARPVREVVRIASDTMRWLDSRDVPRAAVLFDPDKAVFAARTLPTLHALVDDDRGQCERAALQGVPYVFWVDARGTGEDPPCGCCAVTDLAEVVDLYPFDGSRP